MAVRRFVAYLCMSSILVTAYVLLYVYPSACELLLIVLKKMWYRDAGHRFHFILTRSGGAGSCVVDLRLGA